ncbi:MAG: CRISPR-associated endonuclease Cas3'', partial [Rhabdochlamydiaceae bacterium]
MKRYLAHVRQEEDFLWKEHDLIEHLNQVALKAKQFADEFQSGDWAYVAGLWHDLGKFSLEFQNYIKFKSGYDPEASNEEDNGRVNHSSAGALHAINKFGGKGRVLAYLIAGHHAGLPDWNPSALGGALSVRLNESALLARALEEEIPSDLLEMSQPQIKFKSELVALWIRMLFSCLVDADFLDTEEFMNSARHSMRE